MLVNAGEDFQWKRAYLVGVPNAEDLESIEVEESLANAQEGLKQWGFNDLEIKIFEDEDEVPNFQQDIWPEIEEKAKSGEDDLLIFLYFKGYGNMINDCISYVGKDGEGQSLEGFLRDCAIFENVFVIGLFDCCRRDRGQEGIQTALSETHNLICIYRE